MPASPPLAREADGRVRLGAQTEKRRTSDTTLARKPWRTGMNIRQANGLGRVHVAKPQMRQTYCGRPINEDDWVTTPKEANCTGCAKAGAPMPPKTGEPSR